MKKLLIVIGSLVALLVAAAIIVPLVIDVDKYRPQITHAANEKINGKLELGKLSLSLWGQIRVQVAGLKVFDSRGRTVVSVNDAYFQVPFSSILGGAPLLTLGMKNPELFVIKDVSGKLNVTSLAKESHSASAGTTGGSSAPGGSGKSGGTSKSESVELPSLVTRARLGVKIENALLSYKDEKSNVKSQVQDLNVLIKDLSLSRPTEIEIWANLDTALGDAKGGSPTIVKGPIRLTAKSELSGLDKANFAFKLSLDDLDIQVPGVFHKSKGIDAHAEGSLSHTPQEAKIEQLDIKFFNAEIKSSGGMANLSGTPTVNFSAKSNEIALKPWVELIPMLKEYDLGGVANLEASADGPSDKLGYHANFTVAGLTAKAPHLKAQPRFDAVIDIITDQVDKISLTMKAPANDLRVTGKLVSFTHPKLDMEISSTGMDLDQLIDFPPPPKKGEAPKASEGATHAATGSGGGASGAAPGEADLDALLDPLRKNQMALATVANIGINLKSLKVYNIKMTEIASRLSLQNLTAAINSFSLKMWDGSIKMHASVAMAPRTPTYSFGADVAGLKLDQAVGTQMEMIKNTVIGTAFFKMDGSGSSFNPTPSKTHLKAKGNMRIEHAKFATVDVGKMAQEGIAKSLDKIAEKIPALKGKGLKSVPARESKYDLIASDFTIDGGKFTAPNFMTKAAPNDGIDLKGFTQVGMLDYSLKAEWEVVDTYNMTKARDISVNQGGVEVPHILAEGNNPVKFPVSAGGTVFQPTYTYGQVPEYLAGIALKNAGSAVAGKAKAEVAKRVQDAVGDKAPPQVKNALGGLGKKLFGR